MVATVDDDIAGFVMVVDDEVEQVYVSRRHRGADVAAVLLAQAERLVQVNGHERAWLAVVRVGRAGTGRGEAEPTACRDLADGVFELGPGHVMEELPD